MDSFHGVNERRSRPPVAFNRSNSEQLLLRKRKDLNYLDLPSTRPTPRDRKAMSDAAEAAMLAQQQQQLQHQRARSATAVISRHGNDQGTTVNSGGPFRLNRKEKLFLTKRAKESALALIDHAHTLDGPIQWHYKGKHHGIQMYRGEGMIDSGLGAVVPGTTSTPVLGGEAPLEFLCGVTTMMGTLEEVSEYFDQATTPRMKVKKGEDVVDCAVLYSLVWGNTVNPFHRVSVKYQAYEGPAAMSRPRDFCYLECQDTFRHASGRRGFVLSMHSIKIPSCPEVPGFVRGSVYHSGFVFVEAERPGYMDVMYSLQINFKGRGRVPQFLLNSALKRRLLELLHISREIQVARMAHRTLLQDKELMPKHLRSTCVNCSRRFWLFLRKTRCRLCGEVVCQSCAPQVDWECGDAHGEHFKTRICVTCYSTAPTVGSWTAPNEGLPWTEQSHYEHTSSLPMLSPKGAMRRVKERHDDMDDDDDDEGRYTFAELEEQSSHSVFAPERFTRSSMASIAPLQVDEIGFSRDAGDDDMSSIRSSDYHWNRETEESVFNIGSLSSSIISRDSYFGRPEPSQLQQSTVNRYSSRHHTLSSVPDDTPILMEEPEPNQVSHANSRSSSKVPPPPKVPLPFPEPRQPPPQTRHTLSPGGSKSSFEFLDGLIDLPLSRRNHAANDPTRPRAQTTIQNSKPSGNALNPSTLRAHNMRYTRSVELDVPDASNVVFANRTQPTPPTPDAQSHLRRSSNEPVSLDEIVPSNSMSSRPSFDPSLRSSSNSVNTNSLYSRPSSLILQQVRKNRSRTIQLQTQTEEGFRTTNDIEDKAEDHRRRMDELNQKAIEHTGNEISTLEITRPSLQPEAVDDDLWRSSALMEEYRNRRKYTIEALRKKALSIQEDNRESNGTDYTAASSPSFVGIQRIGEAAMSRSPSLSGPLSDVRKSGAYGRRSSTEQPPCPVPRKMSVSSSTSSNSPFLSGKKSLGPSSESRLRGLSDDLTFKPSLDLPEAEMKLSVPEEEEEDQLSSSRESKASGSNEVEPEPEVTQPAKPAASWEPAPREVSARSLYAEIGFLTQLNSEVAVAEDASEVDRIKDRIQEQYQLIRSLQLK